MESLEEPLARGAEAPEYLLRKAYGHRFAYEFDPTMVEWRLEIALLESRPIRIPLPFAGAQLVPDGCLADSRPSARQFAPARNPQRRRLRPAWSSVLAQRTIHRPFAYSPECSRWRLTRSTLPTTSACDRPPLEEYRGISQSPWGLVRFVQSGRLA